MKKKNKVINPVLSKFLKKTKAGKYAVIEKSSLKYSRVKEYAEIEEDTDSHYYSLS